MITINLIKKLRRETGVSISECKKALETAEGNIVMAKEILKKWGSQFAEKSKKRETKEGVIAGYIHPNRKIGALLELNCETDFVAKSPDFQTLAHELCLQIAAMEEDIPLLSQPWIRDETKKIRDLLNEYIAKLGENITIKKFTRYEL